MTKKAIIAKLKGAFFAAEIENYGVVIRFSMSIAGATTQKPVYGQSRDVDRFDGHKGVYQD